MEEEPELVTIERYRDALEADLAKTRLDSAGITSFLVGENPLCCTVPGWEDLQLQVSPKDEVDARSILNDPGPPDSEVASVSVKLAPQTARPFPGAESPGRDGRAGSICRRVRIEGWLVCPHGG